MVTKQMIFLLYVGYNLFTIPASEFIRLVGFGNAAGLLSEKGLPGFANLKQNTVDLNQLLNNRK
jgi:hypothetical protein